MTSTLVFSWSLSWITTIGLLSLRLAAIFLMTPLLYAMPMPGMVRMFLVLGLSIALALGLSPSAASLPSNNDALFQAALSELILGATLALGILLAFGAFSVAGRLLDVQIGFGMAQVFDPVSNHPIPILTSLFEKIAVLVFFLVNGHHALLRGVAYSLERFPVGAFWSLAAAAGPLLKQVSGLFSLGFALAAPVVFSILLVEMALGVIARNLPQINIFMLGLPIKILVGLTLLSLWFGGMGGVMTRVYGSIYETWDHMFALPALDSSNSDFSRAR